MVYFYWRGFLITGGHGKVALVMAPLILFGFASGLYMNIKKKQRRVLPLLHGMNNLVRFDSGFDADLQRLVGVSDVCFRRVDAVQKFIA